MENRAGFKGIAFILALALVFTTPAFFFENNTVKAQTDVPGVVDIGSDFGEEELIIYNDGQNRIIAATRGGILTSANEADGMVIIGSYSDGTYNTGKHINISGSGILNVTLSGASLTVAAGYTHSPIALSNGAQVNLNLASSNTLISNHSDYAGLQVSSPCGITISAINGIGSLDAESYTSLSSFGSDSAGIGGSYISSSQTAYRDNGRITINENTSITAITNGQGAGIGSAYGGNASGIDVRGGKVYAYSQQAGAGIGSGNSGEASNINITGGEIEAGSGRYGAGIGSGQYGTASSINIIDGTISASSIRGAGIGSGHGGNASDINIFGGDVTVRSDDGAGIGGGYQTVASDINISGGIIYAYAKYGAGIGGPSNGDALDINISGGTVSAESYRGAGIGGGYSGSGSDIYISGGIINTYSEGGAGIGGGMKTPGVGYGTGENITIAGGSVTSQSESGAGIGGGGNYGKGLGIYISGGFVTATSSKDYIADGIGSGHLGETAQNIYITGGSVVARGGNNDVAYPRGVNNVNVSPVDIPVWTVPYGNNDISIVGDSYTYNAKSVKNSGIECEHGESYTSAATVYLPPRDATINPGPNEMYIRYGSGKLTASDSPLYNAKVSNCIISTMNRLEAGQLNKFYVMGDKPAGTPLEGDTCLSPASWTFGSDSGLIDSSGIIEVMIDNAGSYTLSVEFERYVCISGGAWELTTGAVTKDLNFTLNPEGGTTTPPPDASADKTVTTSVKTAQKNIYLKKGQSLTLPIVEYTNDGKKTKLKYTSSKKKVVSVTQKGKVKALKKGKSVITVKAPNGKYVKVNVYVATKATKVKSVKVKYSKTMKVGQSKTLKVTVSPKKATKAIVTFKSSKKSVLTVDKTGRVTAKKKGTAKITVKAGGKKKVVTIKVK